MIESFGDLGVICLQTFLIFAISLFIYRKYIISVFDPLFFFLITQAFSIQMAFLQITYLPYLINFLCCVVCLNVGFILNKPKVQKIDDSNFVCTGELLKFVNYFNLFAFIIIVIANLILISQKGLALLSDDPSLAKFSNFDEGGGFGAVRRINWGLLNLVFVSLLFTYMHTNRKRNLIMLFILFLFTMTSGGKGVVLTFVALISLLGVFKKTEIMASFKKINKVQIPLLIIGFVSALFILIKGGSSEGATVQDGLIKLGIRFLYFGDAIIYYYEPSVVAHFQSYNFVDFLSYHFNSVLGFLRIVDYRMPLGNDLLLYYINSSQDTGLSIGPNTPYYISGHIFFGSFGAPIYSFITGLVFGFVRKKFFLMDKQRVNFIIAIGIIFLNLLITSFPQDAQLMISMLFDTLVFALVPITLSFMFCYSFGGSKIIVTK
jgi:hypothetical protein